jgi:hypothetical protein
MKLKKQAPQSTASLTPRTCVFLNRPICNSLSYASLSFTKATMPFSPDILRKLQTLVDATPNPSPDVLDIWASLFHVPKAMLHHAIHVILPEAASQGDLHSQTNAEQSALDKLNAGPPLQRLPTPANSLTPEPATGGLPEFMKEECNTPTLAYSRATGSERGMVAQSQQPRDHTTTDPIPASALDQVDHSQVSIFLKRNHD